MYIQNVPKVGISSVVHSKHIDSDNIDVVDNDIALFDTESVISLYNGPVFQSYTAGAGDCEGISCIYQKTIEE